MAINPDKTVINFYWTKEVQQTIVISADDESVFSEEDDEEVDS